MIIFKLLCMVVKESKDQVKAMKCIEDFAKKHQDLLQQIANEHPEYFGTKEIATVAISDTTLRQQVINKLQITGKGYDEHQEGGYYHEYWYEYSKEAIDCLLELRLKSAEIKKWLLKESKYLDF